jgi:hypothetical protein
MLSDAAAVAALINAINSLDGTPPDPPMTAAVVLRDLIGKQAKAMLRSTWVACAASPPPG